tara:strand:+ start:536 stop:1060 length:525 start_codon:yes stop_codon:yes gene_type:complete
MKNLLLVLALGLGLNSYSQTITQSEIGKMIKGVPFKNFTKYVDGNGTEYKIGDTLTIGRGSNNGNYSHLFGTVLLQQQPLSPSHIGRKVILMRIKVTGTKRTGFKLHVTTKISGGFTYFFWLNDAVSSGEIIGKGYTSDDALSELKRAKDKLDLGLITQEEFNSKRLKLAKYIK